MTGTKIRTDRLNVASVVKSLLDAATVGAIQTILSLVPGVNVQPYNADILTTNNTKTVTEKTINPPSIGTICDQAGVTYSISAAYDQVQMSVSANVGFKMSTTAPRFGNQMVRVIFAASGADRTITWDASIVAASGVTLPTTFYSGKRVHMWMLYMRYTDPTYYWLATHVAIEP